MKYRGTPREKNPLSPGLWGKHCDTTFIVPFLEHCAPLDCYRWLEGGKGREAAQQTGRRERREIGSTQPSLDPPVSELPDTNLTDSPIHDINSWLPQQNTNFGFWRNFSFKLRALHVGWQGLSKNIPLGSNVSSDAWHP